MKYLFIVLMWLICPLGSASEFEVKPTHIISNTFSKEINGKELYWVDRTGQLNASEVIKFSPEFKELKLLTIEEEVDFEKNSKTYVIWHLSIIKNNLNKDFNLRIKTDDDLRLSNENEANKIYLLKNNILIKSIDINTNRKFNNLSASHWNNQYQDSKSRYDTIVIPKNESVTILRRISQDYGFTESVIKFSEHQNELEIDRFSIYLQGIGFGALGAFLLLSLYTATLNNEKSNIVFFIWLLLGLFHILLVDIDGDRLSEFFINTGANSFISESTQISISQILAPLTTFAFILLSSYLIDLKNNFPKWRKAFLITYIASAILLFSASFILLFLVESKLDKLYEIIPIIISPYYIITNGLIGVSFFIGTIILVFRRHPQAIYLLLCQILIIPSGFTRQILEILFEKSFNYADYFLTNELIILVDLGLLITQALLLNFSIIRRMKFLQTEVIAISDRNRQILSEQNQMLEVKVKERTHELQLESQKSERLMLNILPESIASRLKAGDDSISDSYQNATVLFSDLVGFTKMSSSKTAEELVFLLNDLFKRFDTRATSLGLEKIKTIGDAYMVAGGLPTQDDTHAIQVTKMALGMYEDLDAFNKEHDMELGMRIGINSGPVVAGVIGHSKFSYDLWGNTVNTASRMESTCLPGKVQVSPSTFEQIKGHFDIKENQIIDCKGLGPIMTYFVK
jgi:class 3 adenylate cyclase